MLRLRWTIFEKQGHSRNEHVTFLYVFGEHRMKALHNNVEDLL